MSLENNAKLGELLWQPDKASIETTHAAKFIQLLNAKFDLNLNNFTELYVWSCAEPQLFWQTFADFAQIKFSKQSSVALVNGDDFLGSIWFPDARLNFAENLLSKRDSDLAIIFWDENKHRRELTYRKLYAQVAKLADWLIKQGVKEGDRVAGLLPNVPETIIAMLATTSLGAIWTSCSPDFGVQGVLDRFGQIEPKILFCVDGYYYNQKTISCLEKNQQIISQLKSVDCSVLINFINQDSLLKSTIKSVNFNNLVSSNIKQPELKFTQVSFNAPLYIMFSSGTTGKPKCIVHGVGGTLIQHQKEHLLHCDLQIGSKIFYFTTCGWMMWNWLVSGLASGATIMLYDGAVFLSNNDNILFDYVAQENINIFGISAKFLDTASKKQLVPKTTHDLSALQTILSTGSVLSVTGFNYVYQNIKADVCLSSISGGTDIISCFALGSRMLPVYCGELQTRGLGLAVEVWDDSGQAVIGEKGDLVCVKTFPSKPIRFWQDTDNQKYRQAYYAKYTNIWCHGDYVNLTKHGGLIFHGRSDTVLNPGGVRIGTAEIYLQVEILAEVLESVVIGQKWQNDIRVVLFVKLQSGLKLDDNLVNKIKQQIRANATPRHIPAVVLQVSDIPRTKSGKIAEIAVQKTIHAEEITNKTALANPEILAEYASFITVLNNT